MRTIIAIKSRLTDSMKDKTVTVRHSSDDDINSITAIYAHEVLNGLASFEVVPPDADEMAQRRHNIVQAGYPYLVAAQEEKIIGYAYAGPYRTRPAYKNTLENSVYVSSTARRNGVGKMLLTELITLCEQGSWRTIIAIIGDTNNTGSIELHKSLGFRHVGTIEAAGFKLNRWVDSVIMQKMLAP